MCSTYSIFTRSGPQTNTAYVFGASTTSATSCGQLLRVVRAVDEHGEVVQERPLRLRRIAGVELEERAADLDARNTVARLGLVEAEGEVLARGCLGVARVQRDVVEVVVDLGLRLDDGPPRQPTSPTS